MTNPNLDGGGNEKAVAVSNLRSLLERVERLEDDKKAIAEDIKQVKTEAKAFGFDMKMFNQMLRERKMDPSERGEFYAIEETYRASLGMLTAEDLEAEGLA